MTTIKRIFLGVVAALAVVLLGGTAAWLFVDDATLVSLLVKRLEAVAAVNVNYQDGATISRTWTPELSVTKLVVADSEKTYRLETSALQLKLNLPSLLTGHLEIPHLRLGDTRVHILEPVRDDSTAVETPAPVDLSALRLWPVLHELQIEALSLVVEGEQIRLPSARVSELSLQQEAGTNTPRLSAQAEVAGDTIAIDASLPELNKALKRKQLPFSVALHGALFESSLVGEVDFSQAEAAVEAQLKARAPDLTRLPGLGPEISVPGGLTATTRLSGPFGQLVAEDLSVQWTDAAQSSVTLDGRIGNVTELEGIELVLAGQLGAADWLAPLLPDTLGALDSAELAAQVSGDQTRLALRDFNFKALSEDKLDLSLSGRLDLTELVQTPELENLDLKLAFSAPTTRAARILIFDDIPEFGAITGTADVRSERGAPALENIVIRTRDAQDIEVDLGGRIAQFPLSNEPNTGYDLDVTMKAAQTALMAERAGLALPLSGPLALNFRIEGDTRALQLNRIELSAGDKSKTLIGAEGRLHFGAWDQADPIKSMDLAVHMSGRDTGFLSAWTEQDFPALAYQSQGRLHTVDGRHRIDDYRLVTPKGEPLNIRETGSANSVTFLPTFSMEGIRIDHWTSTDDVSKLNRLFKLDRSIPALGPLEMRALVTGTDTKLLIDKLTLNAGDKDVLHLEAKGRVGYISAEAKWHLEDTDLNVEARSASSRALAEVFGYRIPELGVFAAQAKIHDRDKSLGVEPLRLVVGDAARPTLAATGSIGDIYTPAGVRLETRLNMDGRAFARLSDTQELPELGDLTGKMIISDAEGALGIDSLHIESDKPDLLTLKLDGRFDDFSKPETFGVNFHARARDANLWWALFDLEWPGHGLVELDAEIRQVGGGTRFKGRAVSGEEKIDMLIDTDFQASPPKIRGSITARNFFLPDPAEKKRRDIARERKEKEQSKARPPVFSRQPLDLGWMKKADVDLNVDIQSFDRAHSEALSANFRTTLKSGHLSVKPASVVYAKGQADFDLQFDVTDIPEFSVNLKGENLDPWRGFNVEQTSPGSQLQTKNAEVDVNISLSGAGNSPHDLAANSRGEFYVAMKHGKISRSKLDLLFVDIVGWFSERVTERYENINCAIADYSIAQGVVSTNAFFLDSRNITIAGEGTVDLGREEIDYHFIPRKKSRLIGKAEPVRISGALNDPSIEAVPVKSAALTFGTLIFAPYVFAGLAVADIAHGKLDSGKGDEAVCADYASDLQKAREKEAREKPGKKKDSRWKRILPLWDEE